MKTNSKTLYFDQIQVLRGVAALLVVLHHSIGSLKYYHHYNNYFLDLIGSIGKLGVDFFFILSGFIISFSAIEKYNSKNALKNYFLNRIIRIYIPYLPIGIVMLLLYFFLPHFSNGNRSISILTSLTLIPDGRPALSVAWTLTYEVFFYVVFCISFISKKAWNCFLFFWFLFIIYFNYIQVLPSFFQNAFSRIFLSTYNIEFILGYLLACLVTSNFKIKSSFLWFGLVILFPLFIIVKSNKLRFFYFDINLIFCCTSFIIIYLAILHNKKINKKSLLMIIGNATYSIYLVHNPLQMIVLRFLPKIDALISSLVALLIVILLSISVGYVYSFIFEKKGISVIRKMLKI
jgi:exopolysaccharide production protein ExoZ